MDWEGKNCFCNTDACTVEIKGDIQKDKVKDIQHQRKVGPPVWLRDMESNQRNSQKTTVLCQQMPEVDHGHPLARGHKERITVGKS